MKKTVFVLLISILLLGLLSACRNKPAQSREDETTVPTDEIFVEDVFENDPTVGTNSQDQDPTKATEDQNNTNSTQNQQNPGTSQSAQGTTPTQPVEPTTKPTQPAEDPTEQPAPPEELTGLAAEYKAYDDMTRDEKENFRKTFKDNAAFFKWYNEALNAYKEATPPTPIPPDGNITLN